jgi:hypothetical protein
MENNNHINNNNYSFTYKNPKIFALSIVNYNNDNSNLWNRSQQVLLDFVVTIKLLTPNWLVI